MNKLIETQIIINAPVDVAWDVLMDFRLYPQWNPFLIKVEGIPEINKKLKICAQGMNFTPKVVANNQKDIFIWKGTLLSSFFFSGEHSFKLIDQGSSCLFKHEELFDGLLAKIMPRSFFQKTKIGFEEMNIAFKNFVEESYRLGKTK